ncbi:hypothetical protein SK128_023496 [Halocaridina rubra]|uniref:SET domain-containing protein n=1 Tax=Halocaridina rubra TaxID=373956 RepID=A0AAN9AAS2_HALRR
MSGRSQRKHPKRTRRGSASPGNMASRGEPERVAGAEAASTSEDVKVPIATAATAEEAFLKLATIYCCDDLSQLIRQSKGDPLLVHPNLNQIQWKFRRNLPKEKYTKLLSDFHGNNTTMEMFECMLNIREAHQYLTPTLFMSEKSETDSEKYRWEGNLSFKNKDLNKALEYFNLAVLTAPHPPIPSTMTSSMREKYEASKTGTSSEVKDDKPETAYGAVSKTGTSPQGKEDNPEKVYKAVAKTGTSSEGKGDCPENVYEAASTTETLSKGKEDAPGNVSEAEEKRNIEEPNVNTEEEELQEAVADDEGEFTNLAKAYTNRSAVLYRKKKYEKCLSDINFALMYGVPKRIQASLEGRRGKCLAAISIVKPGETPPVMDVDLNFRDIIDMFEKCKLSNESPVVPELLLSPERKYRDLAAAVDPEGSPALLKLSRPNENVSCLSNVVAVAYSPAKGRHLIAQRAIRPGELLAVETCFEKTLFSHQRVCCTCLKVCYAVQPCPNCTKAVFCSIECWINGLNGDHSRECSTLHCLEALQIASEDQKLVTLVYKIVLNYGCEKLMAILPILQRESAFPPYQRGFNSEGKYDSNDFRTVYHLVTNKECYPPEELFKKCMTAFILMKLLVESEKYFVDKAGVPRQAAKEELLAAGATLFHLLLNISCNSTEVLNKEVSLDPVQVNVGTVAMAVFPTVALANHSCNPTARHYFCGNTVFLRAITFIQRGGEITDSYAGPFYFKRRNERKFKLLDYHFRCMCDACTGNWGTYQTLRKALHIKCVQCHLGISLDETKPKCMGCKLDYTRRERQQETWWRIVKEIKYAKERYDYVCVKLNLKHKMTQEDLSAASNYIEVMQKHADLPLQEFCFAQETMLKMFILGV